MAESVEDAFRNTDSTDLALGVLRLPARPIASQPPPSTRRFALASCQYPGGLFDRTPPGAALDSLPGPADASYLRLLDVLEGRRGDQVPEFLILAGDQIYADATAGLFDPRELDDRHRLSYEAFFGARGPRSVLSRLPAVMRLDDHELDDNWEPDPPGANHRKGQSNEDVRNSGIQEFLRNQCNREPDPDPLDPPKLWHQKPLGGFEFFWADARTERTPRTAATVDECKPAGRAPEQGPGQVARGQASGRAAFSCLRVHGPSAPSRGAGQSRCVVTSFGRVGRLPGIPASFAGRRIPARGQRCGLPFGQRASLQRQLHRDQQAGRSQAVSWSPTRSTVRAYTPHSHLRTPLKRTLREPRSSSFPTRERATVAV